jgi:hypothetical protein
MKTFSTPRMDFLYSWREHEEQEKHVKETGMYMYMSI